MTISLDPLPFEIDALEPHMSARTLEFHYGKHHKGYVEKTNALVRGTPLQTASLEDIVRKAEADGDTPLFNNSAQVWNHNFFWQCLSPHGGQPRDATKTAIDHAFGSVDGFKSAFTKAAIDNFASGWTWLCTANGGLRIVNTDDADTPLVDAELTPLFVLDVWEHAYYLDRQNDREAYVAAVLDNLVNWDFIAAKLDARGSAQQAA